MSDIKTTSESLLVNDVIAMLVDNPKYELIIQFLYDHKGKNPKCTVNDIAVAIVESEHYVATGPLTKKLGRCVNLVKGHPFINKFGYRTTPILYVSLTDKMIAILDHLNLSKNELIASPNFYRDQLLNEYLENNIMDVQLHSALCIDVQECHVHPQTEVSPPSLVEMHKHTRDEALMEKMRDDLMDYIGSVNTVVDKSPSPRFDHIKPTTQPKWSWLNRLFVKVYTALFK